MDILIIFIVIHLILRVLCVVGILRSYPPHMQAFQVKRAPKDEVHSIIGFCFVFIVILGVLRSSSSMQAFQVKELLRMRFMIVIILLSVFASFSSSFSSSHSPCSVHPLHTTYVASDKDFQGFFKAFSRIFLKFLSLDLKCQCRQPCISFGRGNTVMPGRAE